MGYKLMKILKNVKMTCENEKMTGEKFKKEAEYLRDMFEYTILVFGKFFINGSLT
jgi:hypothetical protein